MLHKLFAESWLHRVLAGFPCGMPGIGLEIDGAIQQAPQSERHSINDLRGFPSLVQAAEPSRLSAARLLLSIRVSVRAICGRFSIVIIPAVFYPTGRLSDVRQPQIPLA
ncbi:hypothetical protein [Dickeya zeae]|uniref:hypothetical protein n=1 Tax=Dickeya zeae TaxID=204042 RepID=UPI00215DC3BE|nr:hypothetical protein [Dickeya zeae]